MGNLQIPIVQIPRKTPLSIEEELDASEIQDTEGAITTLSGIQISGTITTIQKDYLFQGSVTGRFEGPCDRCIEPAQTEQTIPVAWLFELGDAPDAMKDFAESDEDDEEEEEEFTEEDDSEQVHYYNGDELDLATPAKEEMVLASPSKIYCTDECKGLCPKCGANLNQTTCDCTEELEETNDSGLKALKDLYPDLPSNTSEE